MNQDLQIIEQEPRLFGKDTGLKGIRKQDQREQEPKLPR